MSLGGTKQLFVYNYANFNPKIKLLFILDSARAGLLKNVETHFSSPLGSWDIAKDEVHTFPDTPFTNIERQYLPCRQY